MRYKERIIRIEDEVIKEVDALKYLGVIMDHKLNFADQVEEPIRKVKVAIIIIYPYINTNSKLTERMKYLPHTTYITPIMLYAGPAWVNAADVRLKRLQSLENKVLRIILDKKPYEISNKDLHDHFKITQILHTIYNNTIKFFKEDKLTSEQTQHIGLETIKQWGQIPIYIS